MYLCQPVVDYSSLPMTTNLQSAVPKVNRPCGGRVCKTALRAGFLDAVMIFHIYMAILLITGKTKLYKQLRLPSLKVTVNCFVCEGQSP